MTDAYWIWGLLLAVGLGTFLIRFSFIYLFGRVNFPPAVMHMLQYIPPAVLSALVWPALVLSKGQIAVDPGSHRLWAGLVASFVAWRTRSILLTLVAGMSALWIFQWLWG
ncbi:MAG: AzlD domain-containing protein [Proteobacteria bacterium]|nr:AzlD domain-containing protein [Pseudomonadota bacterium]